MNNNGLQHRYRITLINNALQHFLASQVEEARAWPDKTGIDIYLQHMNPGQKDPGWSARNPRFPEYLALHIRDTTGQLSE